MSAPSSSSMAPPPLPSAAVSAFSSASATESQHQAKNSQSEAAGAADGDAGGNDSVAAAAAAAALVAMPSNTTSAAPSSQASAPAATSTSPAGSAPRKTKATSSPSATSLPSNNGKAASRSSPSNAGNASTHATAALTSAPANVGPSGSADPVTTTSVPIKSQQQQTQIFQLPGNDVGRDDQSQNSGVGQLDLLDPSRVNQLSMFSSDQTGPSSSQAGTEALLRYPSDASNSILTAAVAAAGGHSRIDPSLQQLLAQAHNQHASSSNPLGSSSSALTAAGATLAEGSTRNGTPTPLSGLQQSSISTPPLAFGSSTGSSSSGPNNNGSSSNRSLPAGVGTKAERFLITAADQTDGTRDERLRKVIHAKYDAGLLKPYNYAIAQSLTNVDLLIIEEHFERLLLDYDRVFSTQGIPACLWRRTGEIYKGNKEFANLIGVNIDSLRDGRLCIYELMAEESAVNYWEKYGAVSFDPGQKAVLTSCVLRARTQTTNSSAAATGGGSSAPPSVSGERAGSGSGPSGGNGVGGATPAKSHRSLSISSATGNSAGAGNSGSGSSSSGTNASGSGRLSSSNRLAPMTPLVSNNGADATQQSGNGNAASRNARSRADSNNQGSDAGQDALQTGESGTTEGGAQSSRMEHTSTAMLNMLSSLSASSTGSTSGLANRPSSANGNHANNGPMQSQQQDASAALLKTPSQQPRGSGSSPGTAAPGSGGTSGGDGGEEVLIPCCFSFTIRRDQWNIPICIVGNFLMIDPP
ncbi:Transcription factor [Tilletia horrida]|uniref:Transcription factor n=1 Tax=Tilletia horrida TaxID=155126 RepID=A0AAN6JVD1_9BASI|nr:Transcription factor [Tilletia horrida]